MADGDALKSPRTWLPMLLVALSMFVLGIVFWTMLEPDRAPIMLPTGPAGSSQAADYVRERLELYDRRARDLQWLLAALLGTGALFTLAQGLFAFFSVQNFNSQAEAGLRKISEANQKIDEVRKEIEDTFRQRMDKLEQEMRQQFSAQAADGERKLSEAALKIDESRKHVEDSIRRQMEQLGSEMRQQFPIASRMEDAINDALQILDVHFQDANWYEDLYATLDDNERQEVFFHERVLAGFVSLNVPKLRMRLGRAYRGLGAFYVSKFHAARKALSPEAAGSFAEVQKQAALDDLHRARFYLNIAIERDDADFAAMNMLGYVELVCQQPPNAEEARRWFRNSRRVHPAQQRAPYNLAYIAYVIDGDLDAAIALYREAHAQSRWEYDPSEESTCYVKLNLGCVLAQKWGREGRSREEFAEEALALLVDVVAARKPNVQEHLALELREKGDLMPLAEDERYAHRLRAIVSS